MNLKAEVELRIVRMVNTLLKMLECVIARSNTR